MFQSNKFLRTQLAGDITENAAGEEVRLVFLHVLQTQLDQRQRPVLPGLEQGWFLLKIQIVVISYCFHEPLKNCCITSEILIVVRKY